ncbi:MAG: polysaccharide biosynthesis/export family protein [Pseudomonadota bacterium]
MRLSFWLMLAMLGVVFGTSGCQSGVGASGLDASSEGAIIGTTDGDLTIVAALAPPATNRSGEAAPLAENDLLEIDVFQVDSLDRETRIDDRGFISLPLIGETKAAGLTAPELEVQLEQLYGRQYLQSPEISVFVKESFGQRVTMDGEFKSPGIIPITGQTTLLQAVAEAGGLNEIADKNKLYIFREFPTGKQVASYSISDIRSGKTGNPRIYGGDVIVAFPSGARIAARNLREALGVATSAGSLVRPF